MNFYNILENTYGIRLNNGQKEAVSHIKGSALVLAGPGSGKTTVITARTAYLILKAGINPENILTLTFNRAAKNEMEKRFKNIFGTTVRNKVHFATFHSFCDLIVRNYEKRQGKRLKRIEGNDDIHTNKKMILKEIFKSINGTKINDDELEELVNEIGLVKNKMLKNLEEVNTSTKSFSKVYKAYEEYKKSKFYMDFDDMLSFAYGILQKCPDILQKYRSKYPYIQVDEGQDLSKIQFEILKLLVDPQEKNIFLVADDDQSIYSFRGAEPKYILNMENQFPGCRLFYLSNNYRSTANIVNISSSFIRGNIQRYDKKHCTENEYKYDPVIVKVKTEVDQLNYVVDKVKSHLKDDKKIALLYRNNISSIVMAETLERNGIKFNIKQSKLFFFSHWVVQDILSFLRFALDQRDMESFSRIYFKMNRYISRAMLEHASGVEYGQSIIDGILTYSDIKPYQRYNIKDVKKEFIRLSKKRPVDALNYIENSFNYFDNVREYCENTGLFFNYLYSLFGVLKVIASKCKTLPLFLQRMSEVEMLLNDAAYDVRSSNVTLTTIHSSKGLEYDCVLMIDLVNSEFPGEKAIEPVSENTINTLLEEERRLFYVGITRAKEYLYLIYPKVRNGSSEDASMFIEEILDCMKKRVQDEICEGMIVNHKYFGQGVVLAILEQGKSTTIVEIDFKGIRRKLDLLMCIESGLLTI